VVRSLAVEVGSLGVRVQETLVAVAAVLQGNREGEGGKSCWENQEVVEAFLEGNQAAVGGREDAMS